MGRHHGVLLGAAVMACAPLAADAFAAIPLSTGLQRGCLCSPPMRRRGNLAAKKGVDPFDPRERERQAERERERERNAFASTPKGWCRLSLPPARTSVADLHLRRPPEPANANDPRRTWKESGETLSEEAKKVTGAKVKVPDAITQTDNSAKRAQLSQMRAKAAQVDEPEALRKMREEREARERAEQEAQDAAASADAKRRAETGDFISGQDLREARLVDEYTRQQAAAGAAAGSAGAGAGAGAGAERKTDIRLKVRAMQGASTRAQVDKEALLHQSMRSQDTVEDVSGAVMARLNEEMPEALGDLVLCWSEQMAADAGKANAWMNGSFRVPRAEVATHLCMIYGWMDGWMHACMHACMHALTYLKHTVCVFIYVYTYSHSLLLCLPPFPLNTA